MPDGYEAPLYSAGEPQAECSFLIYTRYHAGSEPTFPNVEDILRRHGIDASAGYSRHGIYVGATLNPDELAAIRRDRQVEYVERDCVDHVAKYFRCKDRVEGSYLVHCVEGTDPHAVVARHG